MFCQDFYNTAADCTQPDDANLQGIVQDATACFGLNAAGGEAMNLRTDRAA